MSLEKGADSRLAKIIRLSKTTTEAGLKIREKLSVSLDNCRMGRVRWAVEKMVLRLAFWNLKSKLSIATLAQADSMIDQSPISNRQL